MDAFARAFIVADTLLRDSDYLKFRAERYASFDEGQGRAFREGQLTLEDLRSFTIEQGEPQLRSGKQEWLESLINQYI
jgi:xylose isomerase